ncbi:ABC transporter ATP-binding protein [Pseudohalocynthiibacter sp. F2068]|jgi:branched-chain amino acid transport system ATP-binding protein|uniref:ABC transporter ATP-binding protein n=1 Tax=Pseudohalocynthiibacter sp. F2068 TaxID=2926418 RepID=UPI001FF543E0|nr:ABC transporter ATP-binding protein [Pseudohalocynthiibacter sp. F2068]MCK0103480.1 ABC transporter ATP-binding protein [Pseudohalocynthiibacter sp. F2068]
MTDPVLSVRNISKSFGALKASDEVSIGLLPGEIHALIGPNGAGKSTLISQIAGGLRPDSGTVEFLGQDVTTLGTAARARMGLARSFQVSSVVPDFTVLQNVVLAVQGATGHWMGFLRPVMKATGLTEAAINFIDQVGLTGRYTIHAADLAHGERRKLEIAMALALSPKAFLLDEPMAGLGVEGTGEMTKLLDQLRHKAPILLVEHDMDAVFKLADRISVLVYGRVIATGSVDEIRANSEVQRAYLGEEAVL